MPRPTLKSQPYAVPDAVAHQHIGLDRAAFEAYRRRQLIPQPSPQTNGYRLVDLEAAWERINADPEADLAGAALDALLRRA